MVETVTTRAIKKSKNKPCSASRRQHLVLNSCSTLGLWESRGHRGCVRRQCRSELMKLQQALFRYTERLMTSFLTGQSRPGGEAISKSAQVCVASERQRSIPCLILTITQDRVSLAYKEHTFVPVLLLMAPTDSGGT